MGRWEEIARKKILVGIAKYGPSEPDPEKLFKKISRECYPFGLRKHTPYKVWLKMIRIYRGLYKNNRELLLKTIPKELKNEDCSV